MTDRERPDDHPDSQPKGPQEAPDQLSPPAEEGGDVERDAPGERAGRTR